jgi:hypothetical protein
MKFTLDDNDDQPKSNVILIPMAVPKGVFALLTRAGAREGKSGAQLLSEKLSDFLIEIEKEFDD